MGRSGDRSVKELIYYDREESVRNRKEGRVSGMKLMKVLNIDQIFRT